MGVWLGCRSFTLEPWLNLLDLKLIHIWPFWLSDWRDASFNHHRFVGVYVCPALCILYYLSQSMSTKSVQCPPCHFSLYCCCSYRINTINSDVACSFLHFLLGGLLGCSTRRRSSWCCLFFRIWQRCYTKTKNIFPHEFTTIFWGVPKERWMKNWINKACCNGYELPASDLQKTSCFRGGWTFRRVKGRLVRVKASVKTQLKH